MSRRFGRNQRRRAREALAAEQMRAGGIELALSQARRNEDAQASLARALGKCAQEVAAQVGRHALIAGEPSPFEFTLPCGQKKFSMVPHQPLMMMDPCDSLAIDAQLHHQTMNLLEVEAVRDHFSKQMHCMVRLAGKGAGYSISTAALQQGGRDQLVRTISGQIAEHLLLQIRGGA